MNCFKFKRLLTIIFILLIISTPQYALARAGGGGSGSGGSSGGGSGGTSYHSSGYGERSDPISSVIAIGMIFCISSAGIIIFKVKITRKKIDSISTIKTLSRKDLNWDYYQMKKDVEEAFYKVQHAWMERNQDLAREYMSKRIYVRHKSKTEWMKIRKEKNILENIKLISASPVAVKDKGGSKSYSVWIHIKAKAKDYVINEESGKIIEGSKYKASGFDEYWKFIRNNKRWILDEIKQIDDVENFNFF